MSARRPVIAAAAQAVAQLAIAAWVGGHAALGAFAARILFRDMPRFQAAQAMTTVFRSFDSFIALSVAVVSLATLVRILVAAPRARSEWIAIVATSLLVVVGAFEIMWVHPAIEQLFIRASTGDSQFGSLHRLSERLGHVEVLLTAVVFGAYACPRKS